MAYIHGYDDEFHMQVKRITNHHMETDVCVKLVLEISVGTEKIIINDAKLSCKGRKYEIEAKADAKETSKLGRRSRFWSENMLMLNLNREFSIISAYIQNQKIKVKLKDSRLIGIYINHQIGTDYHTFVWEIDSFSYEMENISCEKYATIYYLTNNSNGILRDSSETCSVKYKGGEFFLYFDENDNFCIRTTYRQDILIDELLLLMSFYLRTPVEYRLIRVFKKENLRVEYRKNKYNILDKHIIHYQLRYLRFNNGDTFLHFLEQVSKKEYSDEIFSYIKRGIESYVRSKYLDCLSKYILLYSVLEVFADKIHNFKGENGYKRIKSLLQMLDIMISVVDDGISKENWKDSYGCKINNFSELRNEIMHGLPSIEIVDFLENSSNIISRLEFIVCIVILKELGFNEILFVEGFEHLNVFDLQSRNRVESH